MEKKQKQSNPLHGLCILLFSLGVIKLRVFAITPKLLGLLLEYTDILTERREPLKIALTLITTTIIKPYTVLQIIMCTVVVVFFKLSLLSAPYCAEHVVAYVDSFT